ncbi:MAG: hypothetical protein JW849_03525 [Phycisphaerae bacterium]|nr:hypothetical protein [Phycisphaerae bacterium]
MSDNLQKMIAVALEELRQNVESHREILNNVHAGQVPSPVELSALAFMFQSFYTWIENVLKRIVREYDGVLPDSRSWHSDLLKVASQHTENRPAIISEPLYNQLKEYLGFRHFTRYATGPMLDWGEMDHLVISCDDVLAQFEMEIQTFIDKMNHGG